MVKSGTISKAVVSPASGAKHCASAIDAPTSRTDLLRKSVPDCTSSLWLLALKKALRLRWVSRETVLVLYSTSPLISSCFLSQLISLTSMMGTPSRNGYSPLQEKQTSADPVSWRAPRQHGQTSVIRPRLLLIRAVVTRPADPKEGSRPAST